MALSAGVSYLCLRMHISYLLCLENKNNRANMVPLSNILRKCRSTFRLCRGSFFSGKHKQYFSRMRTPAETTTVNVTSKKQRRQRLPLDSPIFSFCFAFYVAEAKANNGYSTIKYANAKSNRSIVQREEAMSGRVEWGLVAGRWNMVAVVSTVMHMKTR